ncbi:MAG: UDP-N-acetylmuramate dehydrogenase [Pseudomonadota bacterium]
MMAAVEMPALPGLVFDEPMARHTSWRVGGPADVFFKPQSLDDLTRFLAELPLDVPLHWVGLGSNLLVRDGGIRGAVINTLKVFNRLERGAGRRVHAGAGIACTQLARRVTAWGLGPAGFFAGIPGTVGGALTMNAGAFGGETWDQVVGVTTIDRAGNVHERTPNDYAVGYREVSGPGAEWFTEACFEFADAGPDEAAEMAALLERRKATQPLGLPSCGSVFRNPPGDHAARLIEAAGLKGTRLGGAQVSPKHANFIINADGATAADIEQLIETVQSTVAQEHGVELVHEVRMLGEPA